MATRNEQHLIAMHGVLQHRPFPVRSFKAIVATSREGCIGLADGTIPWRCKPDQARFKALTMGNVLVLGYRTFTDLVDRWGSKSGIVLPGRDIVVLYGVKQGSEDEIKEAGFDTLNYAPKQSKSVGDETSSRLLALPFIRQHECESTFMWERQLSLLAQDINEFKLPKQTVYIGGGAATYTMFDRYTAAYEVTLVDVEPDPKLDRCLISFGEIGLTLKRAGILADNFRTPDRLSMPTGEAKDEESGVSCKYYTVDAG